MHHVLSATLATLTCLPMLVTADERPQAEHVSEHVISFSTAGDEPSPEMLEAMAKMAAGQKGVSRISLGNMGEMVIGMSMQAHDDEEHDHQDDGGVLELDLGELTGGKVSGQIVIDMNDMMSGRQGSHDDFSSNIDIQMVMEDENGRREFSRSYGNVGHGANGGHGGHGGHHAPPQWHPNHQGMHGFAMAMPMPGNPDQIEELFHNQFRMMEEMEHLRHEMESFHGGDEDHWEEDHHAHLEEMRHHAREIEEHLDRHHDEMDDQEREDMRRELEHLHQEIRHMEEEGHREHHDDHEDPFFGMASDFVHKIGMAGHMASSLSDREAIAVFGVWMARQHLQPEARVEMLSPMMKDESLYLSVRNAATWVVMDALGEMHRESDAQNTLAELIRSNGSNESSD
ncbi:MAG: hypothetical protein CMJ40_05435 [Phycisphaerae bacterium]|nr:hypothetical protein [Phycisphaerae bacterium]|tara:strand:- start:107 stop:1303 length:1197 start_codon:yes stop_codon:yes gene_type:complete